MMKIKQTRKAFTLVELIVTCVILGILFIVLLANIDFSGDAARESGVKATMQTYEHACISVGMEYGGFTNDMNELAKQLNKRLDSEMHLVASGNVLSSKHADPWGQTFTIKYTEPINAIGELRFTSAGPDATFDTADDYIFVARYDATKAEVIVEYPVNDPDHMHIFDQQIASAQYLAAKATCTTPRQYYYSCACGAAGNLAFTDGEVDSGAHDLTKQLYVSFDKTQHKLQNWCRNCNVLVSEVLENHSLTADGNQCKYCWIEDGLHEHVFNIANTTDRYKKSSANCVDPAYYYYSCSCGERGTETFASGASLGHTEISVGTAMIHSKCYTCGVVLKGYEDHLLRETVVIKATCALPGQRKVDCECGFNYMEEIPPVGHISSGQLSCIEDVTCITCGALIQKKEPHKPIDGGLYGVHKQCQVCGTVIQGAEGHQYTVKIFNGDCQNKGYQEKICSCGYSYMDQRELNYNYNIHADGAVEVLKNVLSNGNNPVHSVCSLCDHVWLINGVPTEHTMVKSTTLSVATSCTAAGKNVFVCQGTLNGKQCTYTVQETVAKKAHSLEKHNAIAAQCTTAGQSLYYSCKTCTNYFSDSAGKNTIDKDSWIIPAKGHTEVTIPKVNPTCTKTGLNAGKKCSVCNTITVSQTVIVELGHATANGSACSSGPCVRCGTVLTGNGQHNYTYASTSTHCGKCTRCGTTTSHSMVGTTVANTQTCLSKGKMKYTCSAAACNYTYTHTYNAATCGSSCAECGTNKVNASNHEQAKQYAGQKNIHEWYPCCKKVVSTAHSNTTKLSTTAGNCVDKTITYYQCACGYKQNAADGTGVAGSTVPGTHKTVVAGSSVSKNVCTFCTACSTVVTQNHEYGATYTHTEPACTNPGLKGHRCSTCNKEETWANPDPYDITDPKYHSGSKIYGNVLRYDDHTVFSCCKISTGESHIFESKNAKYSTDVCGRTADMKGTITCSDASCGYSITIEPDVSVVALEVANCLEVPKGRFVMTWDNSQFGTQIFTTTTLCTTDCRHADPYGSINVNVHYRNGGTPVTGPTVNDAFAHQSCQYCYNITGRPSTLNTAHAFSATDTWSCSGNKATVYWTIKCNGCTWTEKSTTYTVNTPTVTRAAQCETNGIQRHKYSLTTAIKYTIKNNDGSTTSTTVVSAGDKLCKTSHSIAAIGHDIISLDFTIASRCDDQPDAIWGMCSRGANCDAQDCDRVLFQNGDGFVTFNAVKSAKISDPTCTLGSAYYYTLTVYLDDNPTIKMTKQCGCTARNCKHRNNDKVGHNFVALTTGGTTSVHARCSYGCGETNSNHSYGAYKLVSTTCTLSTTPGTSVTIIVARDCTCGFRQSNTTGASQSPANPTRPASGYITWYHYHPTAGTGVTCGGHRLTAATVCTHSSWTTSNALKGYIKCNNCSWQCTKSNHSTKICAFCGKGGIQQTIK